MKVGVENISTRVPLIAVATDPILGIANQEQATWFGSGLATGL